MDDRIRQQASLLVGHSVDISSGDDVVVVGNGTVERVETAVCAELGRAGASPVLLHGGNFLTGTDESLAAYLETTGDISYSELTVELLSKADAIIHLQGYDDRSAFARLPDETVVAHREAYGRVFETALFSTQYTLAQVPTEAGATLAGMDPTAFSSFLWDAVLLDWERQRDRQAPVTSVLSEGSTVRVVTDAGTDVRFEIAGMDAINDYGQVNLPGGEVYTAPVVDSVSGTVRFDLPVSIDGREPTDVRATFEGGDLVDLAADAHEPFLKRLLDVDAGASRLGEFGIGMNAQLDRVTRNMALDEKMNGTVHFAFGTAYEACVGDGNVRNESAIHIDLLVDMREGSRLEVDGTVVQRDGSFQLD